MRVEDSTGARVSNIAKCLDNFWARACSLISYAQGSQKWLRPLACLILTAALVGCASPREAAFKVIVGKGQPVNDSLALELLTDASQLEAGDTLHLVLENRSEDRISFPSDYAIRIFVFRAEGEEWEEVENGVTYLPEDERHILDPKSRVPFNQTVVGVWPVSSDALNGKRIRVMVTGVVLEGEQATSEKRIAVVEFTWPE